MTDRELLELAAKAAGTTVWTDIDGNFFAEDRTGIESKWNPLIDDGDALRLAVKLRIDVCYENNDGPWHVNAWPRNRVGCSELAVDDAATRRAITRAAAEIGKQK